MVRSQTPELYQARRILEAMRGANNYSAEIYRQIREVPLGRSARVLDFGAGDGLFLEKFARDNVTTDCVEPDPHFREVLRQYGSRVEARIEDLSSASYELVYAVNVLEHIEQLGTALAELRRVLKPGGHLFVFVPAFTVLWTSLDDECSHIRRFTRSSLRHALEQADFNIVRDRYFDFLGFPAALTVRALEAVRLFRYSSGSVDFYDRVIFPLSKRLDRLTGGTVGKNVLTLARRSG
jgi:SAM-dependent methyltransferase